MYLGGSLFLRLVETPCVDLKSIYHKKNVADLTVIATLAREDVQILGGVAAKVRWVRDIC